MAEQENHNSQDPSPNQPSTPATIGAQPSGQSKSSLGMDENAAALLTYVLSFITGIVFLVLEKNSKLVKFHAMQSILLGVVWAALSFVAGWYLSGLISLLGVGISLVCALKAYKGEMYKLPVLGDIAEKQVI